jgi:hypothetical protein
MAGSMTGAPAMGMMSGMQRFVDDDRGYRDWLDDHPDGFVINTGVLRAPPI